VPLVLLAFLLIVGIAGNAAKTPTPVAAPAPTTQAPTTHAATTQAPPPKPQIAAESLAWLNCDLTQRTTSEWLCTNSSHHVLLFDGGTDQTVYDNVVGTPDYNAGLSALFDSGAGFVFVPTLLDTFSQFLDSNGDSVLPPGMSLVDRGPWADAPTPTQQPTKAAPTTAAPTTAAPTTAPPPKPKPTKPALTNTQEQAVGTARDYLDSSHFSKKGLIEQLKYEGFSKKVSTFAVNYIHPNWKKQAAGTAKDYLDSGHFSHSGLVDQLIYEGYTRSQAEYGVKKAGL
jgi:hypothetical protein